MAPKLRPHPGDVSGLSRAPVLDGEPARAGSLKWSFGFRFWREREFFGFESRGKPIVHRWFLSLLERLKSLGEYSIDEFTSDRALMKSLRYHEIDWSAKKCPIRKSDLDWVPLEYLNGGQDCPFYQFQLSKANGRVVGFWDENYVFQVVLLDPLHNLQPSKKFGYKVDPADPLGCEYTQVRLSIEQITQRMKCEGAGCDVRSQLQNLTPPPATNILMLSVDDSTVGMIDDIIDSGGAASVTDLFETWVLEQHGKRET